MKRGSSTLFQFVAFATIFAAVSVEMVSCTYKDDMNQCASKCKVSQYPSCNYPGVKANISAMASFCSEINSDLVSKCTPEITKMSQCKPDQAPKLLIDVLAQISLKIKVQIIVAILALIQINLCLNAVIGAFLSLNILGCLLIILGLILKAGLDVKVQINLAAVVFLVVAIVGNLVVSLLGVIVALVKLIVQAFVGINISVSVDTIKALSGK